MQDLVLFGTAVKFPFSPPLLLPTPLAAGATLINHTGLLWE